MEKESPALWDLSEGLFRSLIESLPQNIFSMDREGRYTYANRQYCATEKIPLEQLLGRTSFDFFPPELARKYEADNKTVMETGIPFEDVEVHQLDGGEKLFVQVIKTPVYGLENKIIGILGAFWDVTALKAAEEIQRQLNHQLNQEIDLRTDLFNKFRTELEAQVRERTEELVQSEKMAALGRLVAGVSHEINTPIGIAVTAASYLGGQLKRVQEKMDTETLTRDELTDFFTQGLEASDIAQKNLFRAVELVDTFKKVAVDQSSEVRRVFLLGEYLHDLVRHLDYSIRSRNLTLSVRCSDALELDNYPGVLYQIITNLTNNSILHGFPDGRAGTMTIEACSDNGLVQIDFRDDGVGIPPESLPLIFDPFFTTRRGQGGSGLGLHIVYNLVTQKLGGTIRCESVPGAGCLFRIRIPPSPRA